jgi:polyisoprenoid-binding protein YceI
VPWRYDKPHSRVGFIVRHFGLTFVHGHFRDYEVKLDLDEDNPTRSTIEVTIDPKSMTTDVERRDDATKGENYLETDQFPIITFKSKRVEARGDNRYAIVGDFSLHGVTKELTLDTTYAGEAVDARGTKLRGIAGRATIRKSDFGIKGNPLEPNVAEEIQLVIDVELRDP